MCPSPNHVCLLNGDHTEKSGMSEAEIGLSGRTNAVYGYRLIFIRLNSLKPYEKAALMLLLLTKVSLYWGENEHLYGPTSFHVTLKTRNCSRKIGFLHQDTSQSTKKTTRRQENLQRTEVIGLLTLVTISSSFELELSSRGVARMVHSWSNKGLCRSER